MKRAADDRATKPAGWARFQGAAVPALAVAVVLIVLALLGGVVDLDRATLPKPAFKDLALKGYPLQTPLNEAAMVVDAAMWWLCLSFVAWMVGLAALGLCWWQLHRATQHDAALGRSAKRLFWLTIVLVVAVLSYVAEVRKTPLMSFALLVDNLGLIASGFVRLSTFNTGLACVVGAVVLLSFCLLLLPGAFADRVMPQMRAITRIMYVGAAFLLVWIAAATGMYRLSATLLVAEAREPALKLAPTISLMAGLFLSLLLAAAYLSACAWLQRRHESASPGGEPANPAAQGESPQAFLAAHWPKLIGILMPLLPGAAESVLQAIARTP